MAPLEAYRALREWDSQEKDPQEKQRLLKTESKDQLTPEHRRKILRRIHDKTDHTYTFY